MNFYCSKLEHETDIDRHRIDISPGIVEPVVGFIALLKFEPVLALVLLRNRKV